jgi:RNA polymerase sigma-70 factor (ECF subfamily)
VEQVAKVVLAGRTWYPDITARLIALNGGTGILATRDGEVLGLVGFTVADGKITEIDLIANPEKLRGAQGMVARA